MSAYKKPNLYYFRLAFLVLCRFPGCKCRWGVRDRFIIWEYTYISQTTNKPFTLCLNYEINFDPRMWVVDPDFTKIQSSALKHVYPTKFNQLCLFHPRENPWNPKKDILPTLITWAFLWVEFYETWKITGTWYGAEAEHTPPSKTDPLNSANITHEKKQTRKSVPKYLKDYPVRYEQPS